MPKQTGGPCSASRPTYGCCRRPGLRPSSRCARRRGRTSRWASQQDAEDQEMPVATISSAGFRSRRSLVHPTAAAIKLTGLATGGWRSIPRRPQQSRACSGPEGGNPPVIQPVAQRPTLVLGHGCSATQSPWRGRPLRKRACSTTRARSKWRKSSPTTEQRSPWPSCQLRRKQARLRCHLQDHRRSEPPSSC